MLNQCNFIGRLGRDVEVRYTQSGKAVASFSIACSKKRKDSEHTEWVNIVVWEKLAEICSQYLSKGSLVYVSGELQTRKWADQNGNDRYTTEIVASVMKMLGSKSDTHGTHDEPDPMGDSGEIPF